MNPKTNPICALHRRVQRFTQNGTILESQPFPATPGFHDHIRLGASVAGYAMVEKPNAWEKCRAISQR